jgi:hypothetical protein
MTAPHILTAGISPIRAVSLFPGKILVSADTMESVFFTVRDYEKILRHGGAAGQCRPASVFLYCERRPGRSRRYRGIPLNPDRYSKDRERHNTSGSGTRELTWWRWERGTATVNEEHGIFLVSLVVIKFFDQQ